VISVRWTLRSVGLSLENLEPNACLGPSRLEQAGTYPLTVSKNSPMFRASQTRGLAKFSGLTMEPRR